jgi:hypothetical protein
MHSLLTGTLLFGIPAFATQIHLPEPLPAARYEKMMDRSPFALATPPPALMTPPAARGSNVKQSCTLPEPRRNRSGLVVVEFQRTLSCTVLAD